MPSLPICRLRPRTSATFAVVAVFALWGALALTATSCGHSSPPAAPAPKSDEAADHTADLEARLAALEASAERSRALEGIVVDLLGRLQKLEGAAAAGTPPRAPSRPPGPNPQLTYAIPVDGSPTAGRADAKVTLVEGYEYACYYCNKARATLDELARKYGNDLRIVRKHFVVHQQSAVAPALAACAAHKQQRFAAMDQLLWDKVYATKTFDDEDCWDTAQGCPVVLALARELALDVAKFRADMRGDCQRVLAGDAELLRKLGMSGTPGFFINGRWISGAQPLETFTTLIDEELRKANERISAGTPRARYYQTWVLDRGVKASDARPQVRADVAEMLRVVPGQGKLFAEIATSMGTLRCELFPDAAPLTVANFIGLATGKKSWSQKGKTQIGKPFYDGLTFHRVIPGFMIQGGCPVGDGTGDPGYQFANEATLPVVAGALAMANAGPDTNGSQFFITETARHELDGKYTVFGQCSEAEIVRAISAVARDGADRPLRPVTIDRISFSRR